MLPKKVPLSKIRYTGLEAKPVSAAQQARITKQLGKQVALYDLKQALVAAASREGCAIAGVPVATEGIPILVAFTAGELPGAGTAQLIQETPDQRVLGGTTFVLRNLKANALRIPAPR